MKLHGPSPPQGIDVNRSLLFSLLPPHIQYGTPGRTPLPEQFGILTEDGINIFTEDGFEILLEDAT